MRKYVGVGSAGILSASKGFIFGTAPLEISLCANMLENAGGELGGGSRNGSE